MPRDSAESRSSIAFRGAVAAMAFLCVAQMISGVVASRLPDTRGGAARYEERRRYYEERIKPAGLSLHEASFSRTATTTGGAGR